MATGKRRITQYLSLLALHSSWGPELKSFCNPVLTCHSCALAWFACPIGVLVHYSGYHLFPYVAVGTILLLGAIIGRLMCGWICPFGLLQDLLHRIPSPKFQLPNWCRAIKYVVLVLLVFLLPFLFGAETQYSFCRFCPASALQVTLPALVSGATRTVSGSLIVKLAVLALVLALASASERSFCKTLCPIGALLAPLNLISFWRVKPPTQACIHCKRCDKACSISVEPSTRFAQGTDANRTLDCIVCHDCRTGCPADGSDAAENCSVCAAEPSAQP